MRACRFLVGVLTSLACLAAAADEDWAAQRRSAYIGISRLQPEADTQLSGQDAKWGFAAGINWRFTRHVALGLELLYTGQEADMPLLQESGSTSSAGRQRAHVYVYGLGGTLKLVYPVGKLQPYVGAGLGYYAAEISEFSSIPNFFLDSRFSERRDSGTGTHFALGLEYALSPTSALRFEYRWLSLQADFGPEFGGATKIGGGMPMLAFRAGTK
jgi:opacity protein-like surface antigen